MMRKAEAGWPARYDLEQLTSALPEGVGAVIGVQVLLVVAHGCAVQQVGDAAESHPWVWVIDPLWPDGQASVCEPGAGAGPHTGAGGGALQAPVQDNSHSSQVFQPEPPEPGLD